ncbi:MAG TPA: DUF3576 domain-containing protein [Hypericibacter adhaerens]|uniref:DUF3576 domain-containing protein n=1 Tax=Hypericibacter adhaerens TaxID=2602016 RepID=A0A5J6N5D7_9PROT|nr:DUF3576 domain-containing protein [Hypericibacter adhaerens]QEX25121.1 hypothetical protein FRZ61_50670 [Hypericibacter adhaerens]HWA45722.1 DUF3576 domain-containing protein [Hypericibacter adhaerens]
MASGRRNSAEAKRGWRSGILAAIALMLLPALLYGCAWGDPDSKYPDLRRKGQTTPAYNEPESVFGPGGLNIGNAQSPTDEQGGGGGGAGVGVNSFLWRASLDTMSFMPLVSADPFGGVIITDWYTPPQTPSERFKVNVYILGRTLRADGVRAAVFRQEMQGANWVDAPVAPSTATDLENAILTRARQLRVAQTGE